MHYSKILCIALSSALFVACTTPAEPNYNPQNLNDTPDLSSFRQLELSSNANGKREIAPLRYIANGAYLEAQLTSNGSQRLYVQVEQCRNAADAYCPRSYVLNGEITAFSSQLKCYIQIRNDANSGYLDQALQGLCQDQYRRSYSITISK